MPLAFLPFTPEIIDQVLQVGTASSRYLAEYLAHLGAGAIILESRYVDRHFLDDFASYYARSFRTPPPHCQRAHFFADADFNALQQMYMNAFSTASSHAQFEALLQKKYLGFAVIRPLGSARLGRSVLKPFPAEGRRHFEVIRPYRVHLGGLRLEIDGLAYQQQDGGAAVCASTALWVALQRVAFVMGQRSPTPSQITEAAGSPYPANAGLGELQMANALAKLGYIADKFAPAENRALFRAHMVAALDSQLPVILLLSQKRKTGAGTVTVGHAVTVTGYSEPDEVVNVPLPHPELEPLPMRAASVRVLYVHDDNLGFHAHYELIDSDEKNSEDHPRLMLLRGRSGSDVDWWLKDDKWDVIGALVPKPPKLRLPLSSLFSWLFWLRRPLSEEVFPSVSLHFSAAFSTGIAIQSSLIGGPFVPAQLANFLGSVEFPRHVGVLRVFKTAPSQASGDGEPQPPPQAEGADVQLLCEIILDVTDIGTNPGGTPHILAIIARGVPSDSWSGRKLASLAQKLGPLLIARSSA